MNIIKHCRTLSLLSLNKKWRLCFKSGSHNYCVRLLAAEAGDLRYLICKYCTGSKKCYKIKIDSRVLKSRFWWFFHSYSSHFWSFRASLLSKRTTFGMQGSPFCIAKRLQLYCKRSTFAMKCTPFSQSLVAYFERKHCNMLCYCILRKTAQNSRISSQRFLCSFSSQFWAVKNANIVLGRRPKAPPPAPPP